MAGVAGTRIVFMGESRRMTRAKAQAKPLGAIVGRAMHDGADLRVALGGLELSGQGGKQEAVFQGAGETARDRERGSEAAGVAACRKECREWR